jgi:hypothetical protein
MAVLAVFLSFAPTERSRTFALPITFIYPSINIKTDRYETNENDRRRSSFAD